MLLRLTGSGGLGLDQSQMVPQVTQAVLAEEQSVIYEAGDYLAPGQDVTKLRFLIPHIKGGGLVRVRTRRGPLGEIEWGQIKFGDEEGKLDFLTYGYGYDTRQAANDDLPYDTSAICAARAEQAVMLDRAYSYHAPLLTDDANFVDFETSPDWATNANSRESITLAARAIEDAVAIPRERLSVALFGAARDSALADPLFLENRQSAQKGVNWPAMDELARYWGVKEVRGFREIYKETEDSAVAELYPAHAVVFHNPPGDPMKGNQRWATTYYLDSYGLLGQALEDIPVPMATGIITPWECTVSVMIHNVGSAFLIKTP